MSIERGHVRVIAHVDMDAFFASVEQRDDAALLGKPVLVGGGKRGVVAAASYEARKFGCRSAMPMVQAMRLCPQAIVVKPSIEKYVAVSKEIREILQRFSPVVEMVSIDEGYVDFSGAWKAGLMSFGLGDVDDGFDAALRLGAKIKELIATEHRLSASVGIGGSKFLAKVASDASKPNGLKLIRPEDTQRTLDAMAVQVIPGVGPKLTAKLAKLGILTIAQLRTLDRATLVHVAGSIAFDLLERAHGQDGREVQSEHRAKSIGCERTFAKDISDAGQLRSALLAQVEKVTRELRQEGLSTRCVTIKCRLPNFATFSRSMTLEHYTLSTAEIWKAAERLFEQFRTEKAEPLRLLGVLLHELAAGQAAQAGRQMSLFGQGDLSGLKEPDRATNAQHTQERADQGARIDKVMDEIAQSFGSAMIRRASAAPRPDKAVHVGAKLIRGAEGDLKPNTREGGRGTSASDAQGE